MPGRKRWGEGLGVLLVGGPGLARPALVGPLEAAGLAVQLAPDEEEAHAQLAQGPFVAVVLDQAQGALALSALVARTAHHGTLPVLVLGQTGSVQEAVDAMQHGAADYLPPPHDGDGLAARLKALVGQRARPEAPDAAQPVQGLVGDSQALRGVLASIEKVARYKTNVLILGESGTGKELIARALHARGPRRAHLFVPLNCATLGRELLENELFGHERGAFTGATERKQGLFELADGGTLFLDEIAEMDLALQAKLLRVLERNEFRRVGGTTKVRVDLSVLAATNRRLEDAIRQGRFREDLYYRLKVVSLEVPPLRERKDDIPALVTSFIADFNRRNGARIAGLSPAALRRLAQHDWPGNVRELKHAVESAAILATGRTITEDAFATLGQRDGEAHPPPRAATTGDVVSIPVGTSLARAERLLIEATVARSGSRREAARALGLGLRTLYTKLGAWQP